MTPQNTMEDRLTQYAAFQNPWEASFPMTRLSPARAPTRLPGPIRMNTSSTMSTSTKVNGGRYGNGMITAGTLSPV